MWHVFTAHAGYYEKGLRKVLKVLSNAYLEESKDEDDDDHMRDPLHSTPETTQFLSDGE